MSSKKNIPFYRYIGSVNINLCTNTAYTQAYLQTLYISCLIKKTFFSRIFHLFTFLAWQTVSVSAKYQKTFGLLLTKDHIISNNTKMVLTHKPTLDIYHLYTFPQIQTKKNGHRFNLFTHAVDLLSIFGNLYKRDICNGLISLTSC